MPEHVTAFISNKTARDGDVLRVRADCLLLRDQLRAARRCAESIPALVHTAIVRNAGMLSTLGRADPPPPDFFGLEETMRDVGEAKRQARALFIALHDIEIRVAHARAALHSAQRAEIALRDIPNISELREFLLVGDAAEQPRASLSSSSSSLSSSSVPFVIARPPSKRLAFYFRGEDGDVEDDDIQTLVD